jgi:[amino group carrier protein]-lysine/ornithine hydrolase
MDDLSLLREMIQIYSPSYNEEELSSFLVEEMQRRGFTAHQDEVGNAVAHWGEGKPQVVMLGHIDTVPGEIPVRTENGSLYGRGSVDAKGPMAAFICAADAVKDQLKYNLALVGAVEEEEASSLGAYHCRDKFAPNFCIIGEPSNWEGITLGYKGRFSMQYKLREEKLHYSGRRFTASMTGIEFWNKLQSWCNEYNSGKKLFDSLLPTLITINSSDDDFHLEVELDIGLRTPPNFDNQTFQDWVRQQAGNATVHYSGHIPAARNGKNNALVRSFLKSIRSTGGTPRFKFKTGTSDMNIVSPVWQCPFIAYGPGDSTLDHAPNEHIEIANYHKSIDVLKQALLNLNKVYA